MRWCAQTPELPAGSRFVPVRVIDTDQYLYWVGPPAIGRSEPHRIQDQLYLALPPAIAYVTTHPTRRCTIAVPDPDDAEQAARWRIRRIVDPLGRWFQPPVQDARVVALPTVVCMPVHRLSDYLETVVSDACRPGVAGRSAWLTMELSAWWYHHMLDSERE